MGQKTAGRRCSRAYCHKQTNLHARKKYGFHAQGDLRVTGTHHTVLFIVSAQRCSYVLPSSPLRDKDTVTGSCDAKILCILIMLYFNIMRLSCPHKPYFADGWGLTDIKVGRKLCIPASTVLHPIPACPLHCSSTSNHIGF